MNGVSYKSWLDPPRRQSSAIYSLRNNIQQQIHQHQTKTAMAFVRITFVLVAVVLVLAMSVEAAYRKPPFNGSIFGKRANSLTDCELTSGALSSICESLRETCNAWSSRLDSN